MAINYKYNNNDNTNLVHSLATQDNTITATTTLATDAKGVQYVDATSGNIIVNLPSISDQTFKTLTLIRKDNSSNTVTVKAAGSELINSSNTYLLSGQYTQVELKGESTKWYLSASNETNYESLGYYFGTGINAWSIGDIDELIIITPVNTGIGINPNYTQVYISTITITTIGINPLITGTIVIGADTYIVNIPAGGIAGVATRTNIPINKLYIDQTKIAINQTSTSPIPVDVLIFNYNVY